MTETTGTKARMTLVCGWLFLSGLAGVASADAQSVRLTNIRLGSLDGYTRVVLDFDGPVHAAVQADLTGGTVTVRVPGATLGSRMQRGEYPVSTPHIRSTRVSARPGAGIAVTFQAAGNFALRAVPLRDPNRTAFDIVPVHTSLNAAAHLQRAVMYENRQEYDTALQELRTAIAMRPGYPEAYFRAGVIRLLKGDTRRALINFRQVPKNTPLGRQTQQFILDAMPVADIQARPAAVTQDNDPPVAMARLNPEPMPADVQESTESFNPEREIPAEEHATRAEPVFPDVTLHHEEVLDKLTETVRASMTPQPDAPAEQENNDNMLASLIANVRDIRESPLFKQGHRFVNVAEVWQYWYVYGPAILCMMLAGFFVARRLFGAKSQPKSPDAKARSLGERVYDKALRKEVAAGRLRVSSAPPNAFAKRLQTTYRMTDAIATSAITPPREKPVELVTLGLRSRRQQAIEKALQDMERPPSTTPEPAGPVAGAFVPKEKYLAVYRLKDRGWSLDRIARQLDMGLEEVSLAIEMAPAATSPTQIDGDLYQQARHLRSQGDDLTGLAREWNRETGELELAADLQGHIAHRTGQSAGGSKR